ncbi:MAG: PorV/PorQ family protein [Bacteroidales bacterium]|nr:PorV/PorQ family protein [Bacteroidales bacterium]
MTAILIAFSTGGIYAQKTAGNFMNVITDARTAGMAGAGSVSETETSSFWTNTAGLVFSGKKAGLSASYLKWQPDYADCSISAANGFVRISRTLFISAGYKYAKYRSMEILDGKGNETGTFTPNETTGGIAAGIKIFPKLAFSANLRYISSDIADSQKGTAVAADAGLLYHMNSHLNIGMKASNIGTKIKYDETKYSLPAKLETGLSISERYAGKSVISADIAGGMLVNHPSFFAAAGIEYFYNGTAGIRCGYHYGNKDKGIPSHESIGITLRHWGLSIDGAYLISNAEALKNTFMITAGWSL